MVKRYKKKITPWQIILCFGNPGIYFDSVIDCRRSVSIVFTKFHWRRPVEWKRWHRHHNCQHIEKNYYAAFDIVLFLYNCINKWQVINKLWLIFHIALFFYTVLFPNLLVKKIWDKTFVLPFTFTLHI